LKVFHENTPLSENDVCVILDSNNNGFDYPIHSHPEVEINLVMGMSGKRVVGDTTENYTDLDLVILGPYLCHKWFGDKDLLIKNKPYRVITLQFDVNQLSNKFFSKDSFYSIRKLLKESERGIQFTGKTARKAMVIMKEMTKNDGIDNAISFLRLLDLMSKSPEFRHLTSLNFKINKTSSIDYRIQIAFRYILQNYTNPDFKLNDVANKVKMSGSAFSHFFHKKSFLSFSDFLIDLRLRKACKLLIESDKAINEISYLSGFNNLANFNRLFKKYRDIPPSKFRNKYVHNSSFEFDKQLSPWQFMPSNVFRDKIIKPSKYATRIVHF
jgi:AraC-like DNA-binding protein